MIPAKTLNIHDHGKDHRLALGLGVEEFGDVVTDVRLHFHAVDVTALQIVEQRVVSDLTDLVHQLLRLTHIDKAARDDIRP